MMTAQALKAYSRGVPLILDDDGNVIRNDNLYTLRPDQRLTDMAKQLEFDSGRPFEECLAKVRYENPDLAQQYHKFQHPLVTKVDLAPMDGSVNDNIDDPLDKLTAEHKDSEGSNGADEEVMRKAKNHCVATGEKNLQKAISWVLSKDVDLQRRYSRCFG